ncbi:trypsin-like peptidase domain-containing protein [Sulfuricurvum sp.]|uniref:trypsin-like peptidase domain-containing protein n=1 Tax=Sulfuricurvum sp. TaxID=2025608 RepID=UPI003BB58B41
MKIALILLTLIYSVSIASEPTTNLTEHVKAALPSVVKIKVQKSEVNRDESELTATDSGSSGFILNEQSYIVTNAHVIGDGKKISVIDYQNNEFPAYLVAKDDKTDIAVLQSYGLNTPALAKANRDVNIGEGVFAVGSPFSLGHSVSYGIVGAVNRFLPNYPYLQFIQIDAAINPGNSGGPLFNQKGELVGMISTYFSKQGSYTNIAFALPIADVHRITTQLIEQKKIIRGYLGAEFLSSERISRKLGLRASIFVSRIEPNSSAQESGLQTGDLIIGFNEITLNDGGELHRYMEQSRPNEMVTLSVIREKQRKNITIKLGSSPIHSKEIINAGTADSSEKLGLILREENSEIEVVFTYGMAKIVGINPKDRIKEINGIETSSLQECNTQLSKLKEGEIALVKIKRENSNLVVPIGNKTALKAYSSQN